MNNTTRILVIDDEKGMRDILYKIFRAWGYKVEVGENAKQGIRKLKSNHFDVILLDIVIPKEEFEDNFRALQRCNPQVPIIIITGLAPLLVEGLCDEDIKEAAVKVVCKPFKLKDLIFSIEKVLEQKDMEKFP